MNSQVYPKPNIARKPKRRTHPMTIINREGEILYRTRLMFDMAAAARFAKMLDANPRFVHPEIYRSDRSAKPAWYVAYAPANPSRADLVIERKQQERYDRYMENQLAYKFIDMSPTSARIITPAGDHYVVTENSCTCQDYLSTCRKLNILCKHILCYLMRPPVDPGNFIEPSEQEPDDDFFASTEFLNR